TGRQQPGPGADATVGHLLVDAAKKRRQLESQCRLGLVDGRLARRGDRLRGSRRREAGLDLIRFRRRSGSMTPPSLIEPSNRVRSACAPCIRLISSEVSRPARPAMKALGCSAARRAGSLARSRKRSISASWAEPSIVANTLPLVPAE